MGIIKEDASLVTILILFSILAIAIVLIVTGAKVYLRGHQSEFWPTIQGQITSSGFVDHRDEDNHAYFTIKVKYEYQINGKRHFNDNITSHGISFDTREQARNFLIDFPEKKNVEVFYNPDDPEISVLEPGYHGGAGPAIFAGCFLGLLALLFIRIIVLDF